MALLDEGLRTVRMNACLRRLLEQLNPGTQAGDLLDHVAPESRQAIARAAGELRSSGASRWSAPARLLRGDTPAYACEFTLTVSPAGAVPDAAYLAQVHAASDLLEALVLRDSRERLLAAKAFLRIAGQLGRIGAWTWDTGAASLFLSQEARVLLDLPGDVSPDRVLTALSSADRVRLIQALNDAAQRGTAFGTEVELTRKPGTWLRITCEPVWNAEGAVVRLEGAIQDVTEGRSLQRELIESQRTLQGLIANLNGMVYRCDNAPSWPLSFVSDGCVPLTGYTAGQLMAAQPAYGQLIHAQDAPNVWADVQDAVCHRRRFQLVYRIRTATGEEKWVWEQGSGVFAADGALRWIEGFVTDITEHQRARQEIRELNETLERKVRDRTQQLEAANADLEAFGYSIAHDLRAPIAAIAGFSEALLGSLAHCDERSARLLRRIHANAQRMDELTEGLLALARLSNAPLHCEEVDLTALAREILAGLREEDPERSCELHIQEGMVAAGDHRLLRQLFTNLLANAWKFSRPKSVTRIWVSQVQDSSTGAVYSVADEGVGFELDDAAAVFQPFRRFHDASQFEGTGIGLALVRKIVQRHGGEVWVRSRPGAGATFHFTLGRCA